jgi:hypothetical protein
MYFVKLTRWFFYKVEMEKTVLKCFTWPPVVPRAD